uniref:Lysozyme family protein n=1 Tax=Candidatus Kentrum sp. SD TaxID=2126332 RepID=A0A451BHN2_9GAMM|nr:MAG: Lysozyme family protein [Candidatus Kentron sp. SD]VFK39147.1 MAG: Lysozyme family protein [Candidatus Kentron sp. SD]VFK77805.1 MAG: Lysozyme family protein [Candidatus Kentron sp. SD]
MRENFERALERVLLHEGGYVDHPRDPGGAINRGVTLETFRRFYGASMTKEDLKAMTDGQVRQLYKADYWDKCRCDDLPHGMDYVVFDQAAHSGPGRSVKWLQQGIGLKVDGEIGPWTITAASQCSPFRAIENMCEERLAFMKNIRNGESWMTFGKAWQRRVDDVRTHALALASDDPADAEPSLSGEKAPSVDYEIIRQGARGEWVRKLQGALDSEVDGIYGAETRDALKRFQGNAGLEVDGVAGRNTWRALGLIA